LVEIGLSLALRAPVLFFLILVQDQLGLELVHRAASLGDEPADVASHLRELAGPKDHQKEHSDDDQLLKSYTERHMQNITWGLPGYNGSEVPREAQASWRFDRRPDVIYSLV
jgi:hypothetical protein